MKADKKHRYLITILIIIMLALLAAIIWVLLTSPGIKSLLDKNSESTESKAVTEHVQEEDTDTEIEVDIKDSSGITDTTSTINDSSQDESQGNTASGEMIIESGGELIIIVPDGEDSFGE